MNYLSAHVMRERQSGVSLVVVLLLLLVMTIIGMAVLRGTLLEQRMSANLADRNMAFQQAESALRQAEAQVLQQVKVGGRKHVIGANCNPESAQVNASDCGIPANAYTGGGTCLSAGIKQGCWYNAADPTGAANKSAGTPQYYIQFTGLRDTADLLGLQSSANSSQYGNNSSGDEYEATFMIFSRSHDAAANRGRAVVVLQGNVAAR